MSFYDGDQDAIAVVASFVAAGFGAGEPVLVVATAEHRPLLDAALVELGFDPQGLRSRGRFVTLDAEETLAELMVEGMPDASAFRATVGGLLDDVQGVDARVRVFGEMVAVLWDEGNIAAALALEGFWNELARQRSFALLCAYPHAVLDQVSLADVGRVCALHSEVKAPTSYHAAGQAAGDPDVQHTSWAFLPVPKAVPALRRFVSGTLRAWGEEALVADAVTVSSEIATNAISHADSPFHASIERSEGVVRIAVEDAGPGTAEQRQAAHEDVSGRGIMIVEALTERWGHGHLPGGKVVWAEFPSTA
ncbi:hypothetical protein GCM10009844_43020 [Nocardioides koreensis]|uniref:Sensor histidine kinase n=1 Tax=Nocardioides koreensis TaxID=433651 RepID=A0ABN3A8D0_9ACTN